MNCSSPKFKNDKKSLTQTKLTNQILNHTLQAETNVMSNCLINPRHERNVSPESNSISLNHTLYQNNVSV